MNDTLSLIGFSFSFGLSIVMLYLRMKKWFKTITKNILTLSLTIIGVIGFIISDNSGFRFLFYSMLVPPIYYLIDNLFKLLSIKFQGRDFYLYLNRSDDIDNHVNNISFLDIVISFTILALIFGLGMFGAGLFGKENWYNRWFIY